MDKKSTQHSDSKNSALIFFLSAFIIMAGTGTLCAIFGNWFARYIGSSILYLNALFIGIWYYVIVNDINIANAANEQPRLE